MYSHWCTDKSALIFEDQKYSYGELIGLSNRIANRLIQLGVIRGDRVALYLPNTPEYVIAYLGVLKIGAIAVSINPALKAIEVQFILQDCEASVVITTAQLSEHLEQKSLRILTEQQLHELLTQITPTLETVAMGNDDAAVILYTSGTTGFPKGAVLTHGNLQFSARQTATAFQLTPAHRLLLCLPLCHSFGQTSAFRDKFETWTETLLRWNGICRCRYVLVAY